MMSYYYQMIHSTLKFNLEITLSTSGTIVGFVFYGAIETDKENYENHEVFTFNEGNEGD